MLGNCLPSQGEEGAEERMAHGPPDSTGIWALLELHGSQSPSASKGHRLIDLFNPKLEVKLTGQVS